MLEKMDNCPYTLLVGRVLLVLIPVSWVKPDALPQPSNWNFSQSTPLLASNSLARAPPSFQYLFNAWAGHGLFIEPAHAPIKSFLPPFYL